MDDIFVIIAGIRNNNQHCLELLKSRYKPLLTSESSSFVKSGSGNFDDLLYIAEAALIKAALTFDEKKKVDFGYYAKLCIRRSLISMYRKSKKINKKVTKQVSHTSYDIDLSKFEGMSEEEIKSYISSRLSKYEVEVFNLYIDGYKPSQISRILGRDVKSVCNAIFRIRSKIRTI